MLLTSAMHPIVNAYHSRNVNGMFPTHGNHALQGYVHPSPQQPLFAPNHVPLHRPAQPPQHPPPPYRPLPPPQPSQASHTQNQWSNPIPPNAVQPNHSMATQPNLQQSQPNSAWANQVPQSFSAGMAAMGFNPLFQQQLFQDALAMSQPVQATDEPLLVQTLLSAKKRKETFKDALNSLHGKNGHSASLWKDYYLDRKDHIDTWLAMCLERENQQSQPGDRDAGPSTKHERRSTVHNIKMEVSPARIPSGENKKRKLSGSGTPAPSKGRRSTLNSLSAPEPVFNDRLPAPHSQLQVPDPPSRSPSPPTKIIPQGRGNKYTDEDREFFHKFISWKLRQDPSLTRMDLCDMLAEKAPHHSAYSWASYWSNHHDLPDKILASARGETVSDGNEDEHDEEQKPLRRRPRYCELSTDEEGEEEQEDKSESEEGGSSEEEEDDDNDDDDDSEPVKRYSASEMGSGGGAYTDADLYMMAKHAAKYDKWMSMTAKDRWESFAEKYPQRAAKSWAEGYRRYENDIVRLTKKIRKQLKNAVPERHARPSRPLGKLYDNMDDEDSEEERARGKRKQTV